MNVVKVAIAGLGPRGYHMYGKYQLLFPDRMKVVAIADIDKSKVDEAKDVLSVSAENCFSSAEEMFSKPKLADIAIIATQDAQHVSHAVMAMGRGYDLLLEKPISNTMEGCLKILDVAHRTGSKVVVCHVLRYTMFYDTIKQIIDDGKIGDIVSINANENVGFWHQAHSFVRGNWRNSDMSSPMILQKCCHDLDILNFLTGKKCISISSYGNNHFFNKEHQPDGASKYCLDCKYQDTCVYSAKRIYLSKDSINNKEWLCYVVAPNPTPEKLVKNLKTGQYGRCVFDCDNNVVDHQTVNIQYEDGITANLTMCAFSQNNYRTIRIMGTAGEIEGNQETNIIRLIRFDEDPVYYDINKLATDLSGHGGGDNAMLTDLFESFNENKNDMASTIDKSMQSHFMAFMAEESRKKEGEVIDYQSFLDKK